MFKVSFGISVFITHSLILGAGIFLIYMYTEKEDYSRMADDIIASIMETEGGLYINPYLCRVFP